MSALSKAPLIAITGNVGSGKSQALNFFREKGYVTLSSDALVAHLYQYDRLLIERLKQMTPALVKNNQVDKSYIKAHLYQDNDFKNELEAIVHQRVYEVIDLFAYQLWYLPFLVVEVPLLVESQKEQFFSKIIVIKSSPDIIKTRLQKMRNYSLEYIQAILAKQATSHQGHYQISNDGSKEELYESLALVLERILSEQFIRDIAAI